MQYEEEGYLPDAMVNFLARLGWAHGDDEVFTREQFVTWFDLEHISAAPSRFNADKLKWLNKEHMKRLPEEELGCHLVPYLARAGLDPGKGPAPGAVAVLLRERVATLAEMAAAAHYFYAAPQPLAGCCRGPGQRHQADRACRSLRGSSHRSHGRASRSAPR